MSTLSEYDKKVNTVKGLYISALVFASISLLGKILYVVTGDRDSMAKLESRLLSATHLQSGVVSRVVQVGLDGGLTLAVVLLACAVAVQNDLFKHLNVNVNVKV